MPKMQDEAGRGEDNSDAGAMVQNEPGSHTGDFNRTPVQDHVHRRSKPAERMCLNRFSEDNKRRAYAMQP